MSLKDGEAQLMLCLDFKASASDPRGYPIEVAIADVATGATREWLIAPAPRMASKATSPDAEGQKAYAATAPISLPLPFIMASAQMRMRFRLVKLSI